MFLSLNSEFYIHLYNPKTRPDPEIGGGRSQKQIFRLLGPQLVYNSATKKVGDERCGTKVESETNLGKRIREIRSLF